MRGDSSAGIPQPLFQTRLDSADYLAGYAVASNGQRFLLNTPDPAADERALTVVVNWNPKR